MNFLDNNVDVETLTRRLEEAEHERDRALERVGELEIELAALGDVIGTVVEKLGLKGRDGDDLIEAVEQIERFLDGRELTVTVSELGGIAREVRLLIDWAHVGVRAVAGQLYESRGAGYLKLDLASRLFLHMNEPIVPRQIWELTSTHHGATFTEVETEVTAISDMLNKLS